MICLLLGDSIRYFYDNDDSFLATGGVLANDIVSYGVFLSSTNITAPTLALAHNFTFKVAL